MNTLSKIARIDQTAGSSHHPTVRLDIAARMEFDATERKRKDTLLIPKLTSCHWRLELADGDVNGELERSAHVYRLQRELGTCCVVVVTLI